MLISLKRSTLKPLLLGVAFSCGVYGLTPNLPSSLEPVAEAVNTAPITPDFFAKKVLLPVAEAQAELDPIVPAQGKNDQHRPTEELPAEVGQDWWSRVQADLATAEYEIKWQEDKQTYSSPNRAQNLRFDYYENGFLVTAR